MTTGASSLDPMMTAVIGRLEAQGFTGAGFSTGGVFDAVTHGATYPYSWLTMREDPREMSTFGRLGFEVLLWLRVYDDYEGHQRIDTILGKAALILHHQHAALSPVGWVVNHLEYLGAGEVPDVLIEGKQIRQKLGRFRALVSTS